MMLADFELPGALVASSSDPYPRVVRPCIPAVIDSLEQAKLASLLARRLRTLSHPALSIMDDD